MGLRSMADVSLGAFIGSLEQALPHFVEADVVCQQFATVLGEMRDARHRWRDLINIIVGLGWSSTGHGTS